MHTLKLMWPYLVSVSRGNVVVLGSQIGGSHNEVHVEVCIIILLEHKQQSQKAESRYIRSGDIVRDEISV